MLKEISVCPRKNRAWLGRQEAQALQRRVSVSIKMLILMDLS
jgi:hypothetical protein